MKQTLEQRFLDLSVKYEQLQVDYGVLEGDVRELVGMLRKARRRFTYTPVGDSIGFEIDEVLIKHQPTTQEG